MTKEEFDTTSTENLICPYCGVEQEDAKEQEDWGTPETWTCCDCTRDFVYSTETFLRFTSEDLGEYLEQKLSQEKYWLLILEKNVEELEKGNPNNPSQLEKEKIKIEKCKQKIIDLEEKFKMFAAQCFEPIDEEKND